MGAQNRPSPDRDELLTDLAALIKHDYGKLALHGVWEFIPPSDSAGEIALLCRRMGQKIESHLQQGLAALADGAQLDDLCDTGLIPGYEPPQPHDQAEAAFYDFIMLVRTLDLQQIAQRVIVESHPCPVASEDRAVLIEGLKNYSKKVIGSFYRDTHDLWERKTRVPGLMAALKRAVAGKTNIWPSQPLPKIWPPLQGEERKAAPQAQKGGYRDGWFTALDSLYEKLQTHHFDCVHTGAYAGLMVAAHNDLPVLPRALDRFAIDLFHDVRREMQQLLADVPQQSEGSFAQGAQDALTQVQQLIAAADYMAHSNDDSGLERAGRWLVEHWTAQIGRIIVRNGLGNGQPSAPAATLS